MKFLNLFVLVEFILATTVWGQAEKWLEYHTGNTELGYRRLEVSTNAPSGVAMPKLDGQVWYAQWKTPMDPTGGRWLCFSRTRKSGPCDRLYIDANGNGRLDDKTPILARLDDYSGYFSETPVVFKGEDGPITYHLTFRFYQYDPKEAPQVLMASSGWYEGVVDFDDAKKRIKLVDGNVNGAFNDLGLDTYSNDRIRIVGDKTGDRFLGRMVEVDGKLFNIEVARDGAFVKVRKAENVVLGPIQVPENIAEFSAYGENGYFIRKPQNGGFNLPVGQYRMVRWLINRKDDKGAAWTLSGYNFPDTARFEVAADKPATLQIGEPVKAELSAEEQGKRQIAFNLKFVGQQKESVDILVGGNRPRGPKLILANADGTLAYTNTFEFG